MSEQQACPTPANHQMHMCALKSKGMNDEIARLSSKPAFVCGNCGAKANSADNLCKPQAL